MSSAAFFDLDRTVMSGASTWYFGVAALRRGFYSRRALARDAWKAIMFSRKGSTDDTAAAIRAQILDAVRGHRRADMDRLLPDVLGPIINHVHRDIFLRILEHEEAGIRTYLCSASPIEIVEPVARALNMSGGALATVAAVDADGVYTGELDRPFCYADGKRVAIEREALRADIDLTASYAYSDSVSDLPMLEAVGHPVVVNPDAELHEIAGAREWPELTVVPPARKRPWRAIAVTAAVAGTAGYVTGRMHR